ncbi:MAG: hypothetical protein IPO08_21875 [Xanthomonadales bacterium]|nr:hypothetical protein [Xanthomonadales bacterium]
MSGWWLPLVMQATLSKLTLARTTTKCALLDTLPDKGDFSNKAIFYEEIGKSLNKSEFFSTLAEMGNASNRQRLMGGTGWSEAQPDALAARNGARVVCDSGAMGHLRKLAPACCCDGRKLRGVEPDWVQARSLVVNTADGKRITLRGGYSPVIYDPRSHGKSMGHADEKQGMDMVRFARGAATVNRSFTKPRVEEVKGRPLLRSFDAKLNAIQDTLHYLHWQEWVMDASRFVKHLDPVIREHYGHEPMVMLKTWVADMAGGMQAPRNAAETWMTSVSRNVSWTTLAFNLASAAGQVSGYTQSMVVLGEGGSAVSGSVWMAKGLAHVIASPKQAYKDAIAKSDFLLKRTTTRLQALAEISAQVKGDGKKMQAFKKAGWAPMLAMQTAVDIPTWWAGYEKAMADPANNGDEARAVMLADQVVKDSQGSGLQMDLTAVERSTGALRLFTGFMMFMNTTMNLNYRVLRNDTSMGREGA